MVFQITDFISYLLLFVVIVMELLEIIEYSVGKTAYVTIFTLNILVNV